MCRASEDDLPLSLEVRRALNALIRQVEEQIAQLHERRNEAIAVLGSMEDDQDSEDGSDSEDDPDWEYDLDSEDEDDQGSEDDQDSEDGQDSEDDLSQSPEFWFFFIIMFLFWSAFLLLIRSLFLSGICLTLLLNYVSSK